MDFLARLRAWHQATFPLATTRSVWNHFVDEAMELQQALWAGKGDPAEETADCLMLLLALATVMGQDPLADMERKFAVLQTRRWGPDGRHIKE